jgi:aminomethyltransferase
MSDLKITALNDWHKKSGARMVEYAGWEMPIQYVGIKDEHLFTRSDASVFDVSNMGEIRFKGAQALEALSHLIPTDIDNLIEGQAQYSFLTNENGGVVDDLIVYCFQKNTNYMICVNAANTDKAFLHVKKYTSDFDVSVTNESKDWAQIALQGPKALDICESVFEGTKNLKPFSFFESEDCIVAFTGYTGESGVEVFVPNKHAESVWEKFLSGGAKPCGLAARDSLRLEAALNLYGNELSEDCNPFERRMGWTISKTKTGYVGQKALWALKDKASKALMGLKSLDRAIPRAGYEVLSLDTGELIGQVTSGTLSPVLNYPIAMVWIDKKSVEREKKVQVKVRGKLVESEIVPLPFVKKK